MIRVHSHGGIHDRLHFPPNRLFRHVRQFTHRAGGVHPGLEEDLVGHPVADTRAKRLIHDHTLDRGSWAFGEEVHEVGEGRVR